MSRRWLNRTPGRASGLLLGALPFAASVAVYVVFSAARHEANPDDKLLPGLASFADAIRRMAIEPDPRTGGVLLWQDTAASLTRLALGLGSATVLGLSLGIATGLVPYVRSGLAPFIAVVSLVPPMAILPILFIVFGLDELSKVVLIAAGTAPFLIRDMAMRAAALPGEQAIKAQTLGASTWQIVLRVVLPQVAPRLLDGVRLSLGPAWLFLISAEAIASTDGLGYRIFLMRRYLAMDVILPYVAWITLLAFGMDQALRRANRACFPWALAEPG